MKYNTINLNKGKVLVYDFKTMKVHNYNTKDAIDDQVIILEKNKKGVVIESPSFYESNKELEEYLMSLNIKVEGILLAYHMAGGTFLENTKKYSTHHADQFGHEEGGKDLIDKFTNTFGESFDNNIHHITDYIEQKTIEIADIKMNIIPTEDAYDIEIPEINSIYTHMLGSNCHSIIAGVSHAKKIVETLKEYIKKNYNLILTSHYIPEDINAVKEKIAYIEDIIAIATTSVTSEEMIEKVDRKYPNYSGHNYLEMTADFFFPKN